METMSLGHVIEGNKNWEVVKADSTVFLKTLPNDTFDACITDPPYDKKTHKGARSVAKKGKGTRVHAIDFDSLKNVQFVHELLRVTRRWVLVFCPLEMFGLYQQAVGEKQWIRAGVWDRVDGAPQLSSDRPAQAAEGIAIMHKRVKGGGSMHWNAHGKRGIWRHGVERVERLHETPKPVSLMRELVQDFTDQGELVLDAYAGSSSTGVACLQRGRRFFGIERDAEGKDYVQTSRTRLQGIDEGLSFSQKMAGCRSVKQQLLFQE
jgi:site-specific DNA-methyltransferase (adenine-specific)